MRANLNTILLAITVGLLGWLGVTTQGNSNKNAQMTESIKHLSENFAKMERRLDENVPRREFELQIAQIKSELSLTRATQAKIESELNHHELEIYKLKQADAKKP